MNRATVNKSTVSPPFLHTFSCPHVLPFSLSHHQHLHTALTCPHVPLLLSLSHIINIHTRSDSSVAVADGQVMTCFLSSPSLSSTFHTSLILLLSGLPRVDASTPSPTSPPAFLRRVTPLPHDASSCQTLGTVSGGRVLQVVRPQLCEDFLFSLGASSHSLPYLLHLLTSLSVHSQPPRLFLSSLGLLLSFYR